MRVKEKARYLTLTRVARDVYHEWIPKVVKESSYSRPVPREQLLQMITIESFYHALQLEDSRIITKELEHHSKHSSEQQIRDWLAKDDEICTCVQEFFGETVEKLCERVFGSLRGDLPRREGGTSMNIEELIRLQAKAEELGLRLKELDIQHDDGMLQTPDWTKMKTKLGTDRRVILSQIQGALKGTEAEDLNPLIDQVAMDVPEDKIKNELKAVAERKGWGEVIIEKISEHKGEIVSLITLVAIEVGKRLAGQ